MACFRKLGPVLSNRLEVPFKTAVRFRNRGLVRKPVRVITPTKEPSKISASDFGVPVFTKLGKDDEEFTTTMASLKNRRRRDKANKIVLEGRRLIADALQAGIEVDTIYFSLPENIEGLPLDALKEGQLKKVFFKKMKIWSDLTTCPGVMGVFTKPSLGDLQVKRIGPMIPVTVICDNVRDPGNMGALIRSVAAAGCQQMFLMKGCVDPWESKVLRAGCGAHFRVPICNNVMWETIPSYVDTNSSVYLADSRGEGRPSKVEAEQTADDEESSSDEDSEDEGDVRFVVKTSDGQKLRVDRSYRDASELEACRQVVLPCHDYTAVTYPARRPSVLVVGGEAQGLSTQAHKLAVDCGGSRVHVPSDNEVESLNTAVAASIILFEMRRQIMLAASASQSSHKQADASA
ncbi:rRNA methyltransferase 3, mitochondrial [Ixodes scapularis]|uniref:rRNA methyltransferase 3, mitochondrial n=1 Tax=Ixodes scapularis TaxID=6945 RepID=UPI001A9F610E|nr:rRNA methyltransferase 3, mitochondrial [Ixodes scapularis]